MKAFDLMNLFARMAMPKETAADRRIKKDRRHKTHSPPRSMTEPEKEYYDKHKTLDGFYK